MKAVVVGGGGFVGAALVRKLLAGGAKVTIVGRSRYPELEALGCELRQGDIAQAPFVAAALAGADIVYHVAAKAGVWGKREDFFRANLTGTENVLTACRQNRVPALVYTSTPSVVSGRGNLAGADESTPYGSRFLCHYAASKAAAEQLVLAASSPRLKTCALRPHLVWGPGDPHIVPRLVERARRGRLLQVGDGANLVDISYVDNVADAHLLAGRDLLSLAKSAGKPYFISQGEPVNLWSWINDLLVRLGIPPVTRRIGFRRAYLAGWLLEIVYKTCRLPGEPPMTRFVAEQLATSHWFSLDNARADLGYSPRVATADGLDRLVAALGKKKA